MNGRPHAERLAATASRLAIPLEVSLELTHRCNFRCRHCYIPDHGLADRLGTGRVLGLLEELASMGTLFLTLTGGEVLLREDWCAVAARARELGFKVVVLSNGSLVDPSVADALADLQVAVEISLYSVDESVFEKITRTRGSFRKTMRGISLLHERRVNLRLKTPLMSLNHVGLEDVRAFARSLGVECAAYGSISAMKDGNLATLEMRMPEDRLADFYRARAPARGLPPEGSQGEPEQPLCGAGSRYASISPGGEVLACSVLPTVAGTILEGSFRDVWESSPWLHRLRGLRRRDLRTCDTCARYSSCLRCPAQALAEDGDLLGPSSAACARAAVVESAIAGFA